MLWYLPKIGKVSFYKTLSGNHRMAMAWKNLGRLDAEERRAIAADATRIRENLGIA